jgi:hypothetical protein
VIPQSNPSGQNPHLPPTASFKKWSLIGISGIMKLLAGQLLKSCLSSPSNTFGFDLKTILSTSTLLISSHEDAEVSESESPQDTNPGVEGVIILKDNLVSCMRKSEFQGSFKYFY